MLTREFDRLVMRCCPCQLAGTAARETAAVELCSVPLAQDKAPSEVTKRDAELGAADLFLATAGWDLWRSFIELSRTGGA